MLRVENLKKYFRDGWWGRRLVKAVDGVSFTVEAGSTFALVGESGAGKSTVGRLVAGLLRPTDGRVLFEGRDISKANGREALYLRRKIQIIFQNPEGALNPRMRIGEILAEPLIAHRLVRGTYVRERVVELLAMVGLGPEFYSRYPWELSGGQNQRVVIARALSLGPSLLVLDEPTSALDVSVQAQVFQLLKQIQNKMGVAYLLISHDLELVYRASDQVAVMHQGRLVDQGPAASVLSRLCSPYTLSLSFSTRQPDPDGKRAAALSSYSPS